MRFLDYVINTGCAAPDLAMREYFGQLIPWVDFWMPEILLEPSFDWKVYGKDGQHCLDGIRTRNYSKHHAKLVEINMDYSGLIMCSQVLGLHYGNFEAINASFAHVIETATRSLKEPQQGPEFFGRLAMSTQYWPYVFGKGEAFGLLLKQSMGENWAAIEVSCDNDAARMWFSPRCVCKSHLMLAVEYV
eukprot:COSAG05_NODE_315_length_11604_cov_8.336375_5_plen_189_part_00